MKTLILFILGFIVMVTGLIEYLFIGCLIWLGLCTIAEIINLFRKQQFTKSQAKTWDK